MHFLVSFQLWIKLGLNQNNLLLPPPVGLGESCCLIQVHRTLCLSNKALGCVGGHFPACLSGNRQRGRALLLEINSTAFSLYTYVYVLVCSFKCLKSPLMAYSQQELSVLLQSCGVSGSILQKQHLATLATKIPSGPAHSSYLVLGTISYVSVKQGSWVPVLNMDW